MLHLDVTNFRSLRNVVLRDNGRLTIIVGYNEAGKSSFCQAIKFAFNREAFDLKGEDVKKLITYGETRFSIALRCENISASQTTSGGDTQKTLASQLGVTVDMLPLLFDRKMCGDGGNKHMKAFLNGVGAHRFNPLTTFANDPAVLPHIELAVRAGKIGTKAIVQYCTDTRAAQKAPPRPTAPQVGEATEEQLVAAEASVRQLETQIVALQAKRSELTAIATAAANCMIHLQAMAAYEVAKQAAAGTDPLGGHRAALQKLVACNEQALVFCYETVAGAQLLPQTDLKIFADALSIFRTAKVQATDKLAKNPPLPSAPTMPVLAGSAMELWNKLTIDGKPPTAANLTQITSDAASRQAEIDAELTKHRQAQDAQQNWAREGRRVQGAWRMYREALPNYERACAVAETEWQKWDHAAKTIEAKELEFLNSAADVFATVVSDMGMDMLQGRKLKIDREQGIFLDQTPISACSESTQWRMEVCIMAAIGRLLKSPILIIDGADVCDVHNRNLLLHFLQKHIVPHFKHCVVTMTATKMLEDEAKLPEGTVGVSKWLLHDGELKFHSGERPEGMRPPAPVPDLSSLTQGYTPPPPPPARR